MNDPRADALTVIEAAVTDAFGGIGYLDTNELIDRLEAIFAPKAPATVWVVWSDDSILGVYSAEEAAEAIRDHYDGARIFVTKEHLNDPYWLKCAGYASEPATVETDADHLAFLAKAADEADRGNVITLTGKSPEEIRDFLFGNDGEGDQ